VFQEQRNNKDFEKEMERYVKTRDGALFIAVHRGKLSDGYKKLGI
jgi:hypothetical protein